jgi:thioredoxin-like negative regulator of GroEL
MHYKVLSNDDAVEFSKLLSNGRWVVLFYADWCGHCNAMKPEWNKAVKQLANSKHINIADINSNVIKQVTPKPEIEGFPTIKMYNNGQIISKFEDDRVADKITAFANSNSSSSNDNSNSKNTDTSNNVIAVNTNNIDKGINSSIDNPNKNIVSAIAKKLAMLRNIKMKSSNARMMKKKSSNARMMKKKSVKKSKKTSGTRSKKTSGTRSKKTSRKKKQ